MDVKNPLAKEAYLEVSQSSRNKYLLAFQYLIEEKKRFLDSGLTLEAIAEELNVSKGHLSRAINSGLGMGFNDYINSLRVNKAKLHLIAMDAFDDSILNVGLKSGFNSKSTFYASFKKLTGLTPYQFKKNATNESEMMT